MLTAEQVQERRQFIGGSEAAAACGISKYRTPVSVYLSKLGKHELIDNKHTRNGNLLEPIVAKLYEQETGLELEIPKITFRHKEYFWMGGNIDRLVKGKDFIVELKTASIRTLANWGETGTNQMPDDYYMQCAHYAIVCGVDRVDLAVKIEGDGLDFRIYTYRQDKRLESLLIENEKKFWQENVLKKIPPDPSNTEDAHRLWSQHLPGSSIEATDGIITAWNKLKEKSAQIKVLSKDSDMLKAYIQLYMKENETLIDTSGFKLANWKTQTSNRFSTSTFKDVHPELYNKFLKTSESRVFRINSREA